MERQERIAAITGIIFAILGGLFGLWTGLEAESGLIGTLVGTLFVAIIGYFLGIVLGGIIAIPKENGCKP